MTGRSIHLLFPVSVVACLAGCTESSRVEPVAFPERFLLGAATAGFQVEMGCPTLPAEQCNDTQSDWYQYVTDQRMLEAQTTHLAGQDPAVVGPGHWELYRHDYQLARDVLHSNTFRMGIEWSRLFPTSTEGVTSHQDLRSLADPDALATYRAMFEAMRARGLEPMVTIHHYTLPLWIHDGVGCHLDLAACTERGWLDPDRIVPEIAKYAGFVAAEYGDVVDLWATQNEPLAVVLSGYVQPSPERTNPPAQVLHAEEARHALVSIIEAHARMVDAVRLSDTTDADGDGVASSVGLVHAMAPVLPRDPNWQLDIRAAENVFYLWNVLLLDAAATGWLDPELDGDPVFREDLADRLDWIGLNYKMSMRVQGSEVSFLPELSPLLTINPFTIDLSEVQPRGLFEMLELLEARYGRPVFVTENNGQQLWRDDPAEEARYIVENLQWLAHAAGQGIDVRGWYYWSFMDNYEWNHGMNVRLGLFAVDAGDPDKRRVPRQLAHLVGRISEQGAIPADLLDQFPIDLSAPATGGVPSGFHSPP